MPREQAASVRLSLGGLDAWEKHDQKTVKTIVQQKPTVAVYISNSLWKYLNIQILSL